jgi:glycosyltransferase involved in cell wall biosynthesis
MTIWIVNHYALTPEQSGGTRHYDIARELVKRGHDVTIVASSFHYAMFEETKEYPPHSDVLIEMIDGIRFVWIRTRPYRGNGIGRVRNMLEFTWKLRHLPELKLECPDVVVGSSVHLFAVYGTYRLAKHFDVPFVMEVRDIWPQTLIDMGVSKWHPFVVVLGLLERFLYRRADTIISLLPLAARHIETFGVPSDRIYWISNGVDMTRFENLTASKRLDHRKFNVLYAGTMGMANNLEPLLEAASQLKEHTKIQITLVGNGPLKETLQQRARSLPNVTVMDAVPKEAIASLLAEADVLFVALKNLPLYRYGMSMNKVFDYMAACRPVVFAADVPENPVDKAGSGIVVEPDDPEAIANAVLMLYNGTSRFREEMGTRGYRYVAEHFSVETIAAKFEYVLKKVLDENESY